ncbi:MAG: hypothetical protein ACTHV2_04670 [Brachybacterium sp.]|uniref:hypothetical protein n=1 Tax=unclassified Brachybacterium TaxID=2623841 RepID=UPI00264BEA31|nr:hypothetical protein [Brachybacterium sp.]
MRNAAQTGAAGGADATAATANSGKIAPPGLSPSLSTTTAARPATTDPIPRTVQDSAASPIDSPSRASAAPIVTHTVSRAPAIDWRRKRIRVGSYLE